MESHSQNIRTEVEADDIELCETAARSNEVYENTRTAVSVLDNTNAGMNEHYQTLQTALNAGLNEHYETLQIAPKEDIKRKVLNSVYTTGAKQKVVVLTFFLLVMTCVSISSVSLVIAFTIKEKAEAVDGSWSGWEIWEPCSTTCDVGMQTRHRNCSNPVPLGNGRHCLGVNSEHRLCIPGPCSHEEVWSDWGPWEACSTSCDVGIQRRQRNCSNEASKESARQCPGYDNEHRLCMPGPCLNGGWSAWGSWGSCSASCDVGLKARFRACTNPTPSMFGSFCEGDNMQVEICESSPCKDGGWSAWGSWGSCSASCNVGLKSRYRTCTNPSPSLFGRFCEGDDMQVEICESTPCKETHVAFNVYHSSATISSREHTVIFTEILLNEGGAYNETSGIFTAPFSGFYQFNGQICTLMGKEVDYSLQIEGKPFAKGEHLTPSEATDGKCVSFSAVASVLKDENVWIKSGYLFQRSGDWNSFSGILIHKT